jgi:hypothetical protein
MSNYQNHIPASAWSTPSRGSWRRGRLPSSKQRGCAGLKWKGPALWSSLQGRFCASKQAMGPSLLQSPARIEHMLLLFCPHLTDHGTGPPSWRNEAHAFGGLHPQLSQL